MPARVPSTSPGRQVVRSLTAVLALVGALLLPSKAMADAPCERIGCDRLEAWSDELFGGALDTHGFSALSIVVSVDGQVRLARGYGVQDAESRVPVSAEASGFRIGSITKTFVAVGIAQLLESGAIASLDDPVNDHLVRFQLPDNRGAAVTIGHLLTHSAGFEERIFGMGSAGDGRLPVDPDTIARFAPKLVRGTGELSVYSNYGTAILGVLIEDVSGLTLDAYLRDNVLDPLGMMDTDFSGALAPHPAVVKPYRVNGREGPAALPNVPLHPLMWPAGGLVSTALDLSRFAAAVAGAPVGNPLPLIDPQRLPILYTPLGSNHAEASAFGMLFMVYRHAGTTVVEHGGGWSGFRSLMIAVPDLRTGVVVLMAGGGGVDERGAEYRPVGLNGLRERLLALLLGEDRPEAFDADVDVSTYAGLYRNTRRNYTSAEAFAGAFYPAETYQRVRALDGDSLEINGLGPYRPVSPSVFVLDGELPLSAGFYSASRYAFRVSPSGDVGGVMGYVNAGIHERVSWLDHPDLWRWLLIAGLFLAIASTGMLVWPGFVQVPRSTRVCAAALLVAVALWALSVWRLEVFVHVLSGQLFPITLLVLLSNAVAAASAVLVGCLVAPRLRAFVGKSPAESHDRPLGAVRVQLAMASAAAVLLILYFDRMNLLGLRLP